MKQLEFVFDFSGEIIKELMLFVEGELELLEQL